MLCPRLPAYGWLRLVKVATEAYNSECTMHNTQFLIPTPWVSYGTYLALEGDNAKYPGNPWAVIRGRLWRREVLIMAPTTFTCQRSGVTGS